MGRRRKLEPCEALVSQISKFIAFVEENEGLIPTDFRLCRFLGVSVQRLRQMDGGEAMDLLEAFREDWLLRRIEQNPKLASFYLSRMKGLSEGRNELVVTLKGADEPFD